MSGFDVNVVGGGLAGSEAAWQIANRNLKVVLWEMRPNVMSPAHVSDRLGELVCSNSLGSDLPDRAGGLLKAEMRRLGSLILSCADETRVPAGGALAVAREQFAELVTQRIEAHPNITIRREEVTTIPEDVTVIATGPLTSPSFASAIAETVGEAYLYFYDALAPIVTLDSIDMTVAFGASRHAERNNQSADYINCPLDKEQYEAFVDALLGAERIELHDFEREDACFFEGCLPVEVLASRGRDALAFGPLRPIGIVDPRTGKRPYAVVQLRQDDAAGTLHNIVGFQTNLRWPEQKRVLRMIPGLEHAEFVRLGQMHRNTFLNAPHLLNSTMQYHGRSNLFFAGQLTGVEGYVGNAASGLLAGVNAARMVKGMPLVVFPEETMIGALAHYISHADPQHFQPMKANFGLLPAVAQGSRGKRERYRLYADRALASLEDCLDGHPWHEGNT
jgi:methylenetetrahydrofolate--tRNA-(uracil-5-)-methyltransferase